MGGKSAVAHETYPEWTRLGCLSPRRSLETHLAGLSLTWFAMVRPSLSILDPASAIFLAALMTSDVFLSGPLPLRRENKDHCMWSPSQLEMSRKQMSTKPHGLGCLSCCAGDLWRRKWPLCSLVGPGCCSPGKVSHLHHNHAHLLGQHNDVIAKYSTSF